MKLEIKFEMKLGMKQMIPMKKSNIFASNYFSNFHGTWVFFYCLIFISGTFLTHCNFQDGGGSDAETITGIVTLPSGKAAALTEVKLIPSDYDPSQPGINLITKTISDSNGNFSFKAFDKNKEYNIIVKKLNLDGGGHYLSAQQMKIKGSNNGKTLFKIQLATSKVFLFSMHGDVYAPADSGIAYFPGTDILTHCNGIDESPIDSVPAGALRFKIVSRAGWQYDTTLTSVFDTTRVSASKSSIKLLP